MTFPEILLLAVGVAMDATAVSAAQGLRSQRLGAREALTMCLLFGAFHVVMPLLGYAAGAQLGPRIASWDHWIAFVLLAGIGAKMLWEAATDADDADAPRPAASLRVLVVLAVATSVDVFAVGVTLPILRAPLGLTVATLGAVTAALSAAGLWLGRRFGARVGRRLDVLGGLVLLGLAAKVLVQHAAGR